MKRLLWAMGATVGSLTGGGLLYAQCAMCRTALLSSPEGQKLAGGFNSGILFLLGAPVVLVGVVAFLIYRAHRSCRSGEPATLDARNPVVAGNPTKGCCDGHLQRQPSL